MTDRATNIKDALANIIAAIHEARKLIDNELKLATDLTISPSTSSDIVRAALDYRGECLAVYEYLGERFLEILEGYNAFSNDVDRFYLVFNNNKKE